MCTHQAPRANEVYGPAGEKKREYRLKSLSHLHRDKMLTHSRTLHGLKAQRAAPHARPRVRILLPAKQ